MSERIPTDTAHLIKRMRRHAKKLQALAPRQTNEPVVLPAVIVRAMTNVLWQAAGRLEDLTKEA